MCNCFACVALIISALIAKWRKGARCGAFQRIFDDGYCKNCSKIRGSCSSRDPARRVSPAGPLCHCFAGIMRSNCALEEGRREERERGGEIKKEEEGEKGRRGGGKKEEKKEERIESVARDRSIDGRKKKSPLAPPPLPLSRVKRASSALRSRLLYTRVYTRASRES